MNRSIHLRVKEDWYQKSSDRAQKLGLSLSEYIRGVVARDCEEDIEEKEIWILTSPDNGHWNEEFANQEISRLSKKWGVEVEATSKTRDEGHGTERMFIISGQEENFREFEEELNECLY